MADINWKSKYTELKEKYKSSVDTAYRLGCEQGMQMAQQQQMQEQQQQEQAMQQAAMAGQAQPGQPGQEGAPQDGGEQPGDSAHPQGSELDQHISQLEGMLGKSELTGEDLQSLKKSVEALKFGIEMQKSNKAIKGIVSAINRPMNKSAQANLSQGQKSALTMQQKIVSDIMSQWETQESNLSKSILDVVAGEGLKKD